jgi:predicted CopG family antitoxin
METTTINVSNWVADRLKKIKKQKGHKSLDSVIRVLLLQRDQKE